MRHVTMLLLLVAVLSALTTQVSAKAFPPIWPMPQTFTNGSSIGVISCSPTLSFSPLSSTDLVNAGDRFLRRAFPHPSCQNTSGGGGDYKSITVDVKATDVPLQLYIDESYTLDISSPTATGGATILIRANTTYGAYHALETLSQLIAFDFNDKAYKIHQNPWHIVDFPRFPHRGLLMDTSRHFLPLRTIQHIIDSVTYAKFNVIHWHIVDAISFPFDSPSYPELGRKGSYSPAERFTKEDVSSVVEYARQRGIRVMVELDTPGHSGAMCYGRPDICPKPLCRSSNINNWALDITKNMTYTVIQGVLTDLIKLFPENIIHLGGDEVDYQCWEDRPYIMSWLKERGLTPTGGYEFYVKKVQAMAWAQQKQVVGWQEIWDHFATALNKKTIIQQWLPDSTALPLNVTSHGYRLIWSDSSVWYLDHLSVTWEEMYTAEPCNKLPATNCQLILGGEGCQWGETVDTSDALQTIWPRAAAIAERLWSDRSMAVDDSVTSRMIWFRCLLNQRGVSAAPVDNAVAREAPPGPGSCYDQ